MNRRSFFKALLGVASVAVIGLPKASAESVVEVKTPVSVPNAYQGVDRSLLHETIRDRSHSYLFHNGFMYTYTHESYKMLLARMEKVRRISEGKLGNCGSLRVYLAEKIVRIHDGKVFKDRYAVGMPENAVTQQEWNKLFGRIA